MQNYLSTNGDAVKTQFNAVAPADGTDVIAGNSANQTASTTSLSFNFNTGMYAGTNDVAMVMHVGGRNCGYANMLGFRLLNRSYIVFPNVSALDLTGSNWPFMMCWAALMDGSTPYAYGANPTNTLSTSMTYASTGITRTFDYLRDPQSASEQCINKTNFDLTVRDIEPFIIVDGWNRWINNLPINDKHMLWFSNLNRGDVGHGICLQNANMFGPSNYNYQWYIAALEDSNRTDATANTYGTLADNDF